MFYKERGQLSLDRETSCEFDDFTEKILTLEISATSSFTITSPKKGNSAAVQGERQKYKTVKSRAVFSQVLLGYGDKVSSSGPINRRGQDE